VSELVSQSEEEDNGLWMEVFRGHEQNRWLELSLVLVALGIDHLLEQDQQGLRLLVRPQSEALARRELAEYVAESDQPLPVAPQVVASGSGSGFLPGYWCTLLTCHAFDTFRLLGWDWLQAGRAHAGHISHGQWWRTVTALVLHADGSHLLNNLVFGSFFGVLLALDIGVGWAGLMMILTGSLGNGLNAWIQPPEHASIGASTAVFGAVGMLMGLQWRRPLATRSRLRRWAPPIVGAVFLGLLGTAGERTDVMAHLSGVVVGLGVGWTTAGAADRWRLAVRGQGLPTMAAVLILVSAWWLALPEQWR
jgi:rhomboid protease GluP